MHVQAKTTAAAPTQVKDDLDSYRGWCVLPEHFDCVSRYDKSCTYGHIALHAPVIQILLTARGIDINVARELRVWGIKTSISILLTRYPDTVKVDIS